MNLIKEAWHGQRLFHYYICNFWQKFRFITYILFRDYNSHIPALKDSNLRGVR